MVPVSLAAFSILLSACAAKSKSAKLDNRSAGTTAFEDLDREDFQNPPISQEEFEAQQRGEVPPTFDIPIVRNAKVEQWVGYFQGRGRKWFQIYMERSGKYVPFMRKILREHDLPEDLVYLAMIESGFSDRAYSRARAVGPWQFMKATGRLYGLDVNFWVDERRDPERSTIAAARHLKDLYDQFQSWKLAAAAYNAGAGKVQRAIKRYRTEDFWELARGRYLRPETRHYVPKIIAAALVAKEPEKYGFTDIQYQDPLVYDKVVVERPVNLIQLAEKTELDLEDLMALNPELNHPITPPNVSNYELRIPKGKSSAFELALNELRGTEEVQYAAHRVRKGDNLQRIANLYSTSIASIRKVNRLDGDTRVRQGQNLIIPVPLDDKLRHVSRRAGLDEPKLKKREKQVNSLSRPREPKFAQTKIHIVRKGETLSMIAQKYRVSPTRLHAKNRSKIHTQTAGLLRPGMRLVIPRS